jgi:RNA polymerase sigma-70 factor (ECF subfamily)
MSRTLNSTTTHRLLGRVSGQDEQALPELFRRHRERLRKMVRLRRDRHLGGRLDSTAVLQQLYLDVSRHIDEYLAEPSQSFFLWLRSVASQCLQALHRQHLGAQWDAGQELSLYRGAMPPVHSASLAAQLLGDRVANQAATRAEMLLRLQVALNGMDPLDREILALCHFEELTNDEAAAVLGIDRAAASQHYVRALKRLREILSGIPGFFERRPPLE